ncbi:4-hydroxy-tetrahydrodipicolinate synthase [Granulicella sp. WH15]|uniref:4-hydroxy-tetrahydrodipicolinate synthase n=1 Tax=Granulicella sp. WH15 TaxID=2602070 RepID=UPI00136779DE|nr:4-hydroxy-tetrahydrodipicolinate synthase [Granulicella sp. WH15]QHN02512.1 4-hydroxy-tetrahydrodipicolinate synthase [Granulicella sp. WH15]
MELSGCGTALVTPFRGDGSLDEAALHALVCWQIENGIELLVPCGTTGEASTLTEAEWLRAIEIACAAAAGRVPVFAGCTHNATHIAVARARQLEKVPGLTGILTANPFYNKPGQEGQYQHFRAISEATPLPILLYNIPGRTGANLEPETVVRLSELANVVGIKESSGNLVQITELLTLVPKSFKVFAGDDGLALPIISVGGAGLISVASNVIPQAMSQMVRAALNDDWELARKINRQYFRLMQAHFWEASPAPVKAVMAMVGKGEDVLRLPMVPVSKATRKRLETLVGELGLLVEAPTGRVDNLRVF